MNKIILENDKIKENNLEKNIKYDIFTNETFGITSLTIEITESTDLEIEYNFKEPTKLETIIIVNENVNLKIYEKIIGTQAKLRTKYYIKENANIKTSKFNNIDEIKEYTIINLDGEKSKIEYNLKTIATKEENYDILTYHNKNQTISKINPNGITLEEGKIKFNVSTFIPKNITECDASQNSKIINLTANESIINPNLYIDEQDVQASHSAWIGTFKKEQLFYLESRGIEKQEAIKLLAKGFITNNLEITENELENIKEIVNNYWR